MRKSFKDSLKALEADIQHANTMYVLSYTRFNSCSPFLCFSFNIQLFFFFFFGNFVSTVSEIHAEILYFFVDILQI